MISIPPKIVLASPALEKLVQPLSLDYIVIRVWVAQDSAIYLDVEVVVVAGDSPLDSQLMSMLPARRYIAFATRGYDAIDVDQLARNGIAFSHAEDVNDEDVADHALSTMIMHRGGFRRRRPPRAQRTLGSIGRSSQPVAVGRTRWNCRPWSQGIKHGVDRRRWHVLVSEMAHNLGIIDRVHPRQGKGLAKATIGPFCDKGKS